MVIRNYFAAANGYSGFRNYFSDIFSSEDYEHIFVLKGGPGTGKSTLIKQVATKAVEYDVDHDKIYCSSDPNSLDGVIIRTERGNFAIIDGTAPHERDAVIPGAIDSIINIGEGFDIKKLKDYRSEIVALNEKKKASYKSAYASLKAAESVSERIRSIMRSSFSYRKADLFAGDLLSNHKPKKEKASVMLTRAFCKSGIYDIEAYRIYQKQYSVFGLHGEDMMFLNVLADKSRQYIDSKSHSPLSHENCDALSIGDVAYISTKDKNQASLDAREFVDKNYSEEEIEVLESTHSNLLGLAQTHFAEASRIHFELENIYSSAVFFEKNDEILEKIISAIF